MTDPYAQISRIYDAEFDAASVDVGFFAARLDRRATLVLGCGTGRVVRGLEGARPVVGVDRSADMLATARTRCTSRFVRADLRDFDAALAGETFGNIVIPNAGFNFLASRADQAACLGACARALAADGDLWLDLPMPDAAHLGERSTPELPAWEGRLDGAEARRTREVRRSAEAQRLELIDRYWLDGEFLAESVLRLRQIWPAEAEWMLEANGWYADEILGDHAGGPIRDGCPRLLIRARRA